MLPLGRTATVRLPDQHQELFASAAQLPLKLVPFSPHLYEIWLAGVGRVLSGMLQASQPEKELRHGESSIPVSYFKHGVGEEMGALFFQHLNWRGKKGREK